MAFQRNTGPIALSVAARFPVEFSPQSVPYFPLTENISTLVIDKPTGGTASFQLATGLGAFNSAVTSASPQIDVLSPTAQTVRQTIPPLSLPAVPIGQPSANFVPWWQWIVTNVSGSPTVSASMVGNAVYPNDTTDWLVVFADSLTFAGTVPQYLAGTTYYSATESDVLLPIPFNVTLTPLFVGVSPAPLTATTGTLTATVRVSGTDTALALTVPYNVSVGFVTAVATTPVTVLGGQTVSIRWTPNLTYSPPGSPEPLTIWTVLGFSRLITTTT
jgi:hypothetical protein